MSASSSQNILLKNIDIHNVDYKLSKPPHALLEKSINDFGIIEKPIILKNNDHFIIVFGHNRLKIIFEMGKTDCEVIVLEKLSPEYFVNYALLKYYRNEIGPVGRLKFISILTHEFRMNSANIRRIGTTGLAVPDNFLESNETRDSILNFPSLLREYLDDKNISLKIISKLAKFPTKGIEFFTSILERSSVRLNIFSSLIDYCSDIMQQENGITLFETLSFPEDIVGRELEEHLYSAVMRMRYPEYSEQKKKVDTLTARISRKGIGVEVPKYFEGDSISFRIQASKKDTAKKVKERFLELNEKDIDELLGML